MRGAAIGIVVLAVCATACSKPQEDSVKTPLPTRQTTIDPVTKKLDAAAKDIERRRQDIDNSVK